MHGNPDASFHFRAYIWPLLPADMRLRCCLALFFARIGENVCGIFAGPYGALRALTLFDDLSFSEPGSPGTVLARPDRLSVALCGAQCRGFVAY